MAAGVRPFKGVYGALGVTDERNAAFIVFVGKPYGSVGTVGSKEGTASAVGGDERVFSLGATK